MILTYRSTVCFKFFCFNSSSFNRPTDQTEEAEGQSVLEQLEQEMLGVEEEEEEEKEKEEEEEEDVEEEEDGSPPYPPFMSGGFLTPSAADATELEREMRMEQELRLVYQRDRILEQVAIPSVWMLLLTFHADMTVELGYCHYR